MSAIFGLFHLNDRPVVKQHLERMSAALKAHGPDGGGIWTDGQMGIGQRLMCFTPEDRFERQPLTSPSGRRVLVFDGRIDNRPELMRTMDITPDEASTLPDSVFIQHAYEKWGQNCLEYLIGSFTFALWDSAEKHLFIARSPVNGRPLFYHAALDSFVFATMPKGLFALPFVPRKLSEKVIADYLAWAPHKPDACFYHGVQRLQPGHSLVVQPDGLKVQQYWRLDLQREIKYPHDDDYIEAFHHLFKRVVSDYLHSLNPVGVMMSGGLDSSSVAVTAASLLEPEGRRLAAFTEVPRSGFDGPIVKGRYADETPYVKAIAHLYDNLDLNLIRTDGHVYLENLDSFFAAAEAPFRNASNRVYWEAILQAAQKQKIRVLLTGGQGNLTISWNGDGLLSSLLSKGRWTQALREARAMSQQGNARSTWSALADKGIMPLLPRPLWYAVKRFRQSDNEILTSDPPWRAYSAIHPDFAKAQGVEKRARKKGHDFLFRPPSDTRSIRSKILRGAGLFDGLGSGYQAMFGVEIRDPTTDVRMIEFCLNLPEEQYLRHGKPRWLIKRAMDKKLPGEVLWNKKRGLQAADWFERLYGVREDILDELSRLELCEPAARALDLARLRRMVEQMPRGGGDPEELMRKYRTILEFGLMTGRFIRWFEAGQ